MSGTVEMKLEMVVMPVSDADRAKEFYTNLGWRLDADFLISDDFRVVRSTALSKPPPGMKLGGRSPIEQLVFGRQSSPSGTAQARSGCAGCSGEGRSGERFRTMGESSRAAGATDQSCRCEASTELEICSVAHTDSAARIGCCGHGSYDASRREHIRRAGSANRRLCRRRAHCLERGGGATILC